MKLSQLLLARDRLQKKTTLANLAFAYRVLAVFAARVARARLSGHVNLQSADPSADRFWPTLTALDFNQSLIEEHFADEDLAELTDTIAYLAATDTVDLTVRIEDLAETYLGPLRAFLTQSGVDLGADPASFDPSPRGSQN
jgi:hypothetical protein